MLPYGRGGALTNPTKCVYAAVAGPEQIPTYANAGRGGALPNPDRSICWWLPHLIKSQAIYVACRTNVAIPADGRVPVYAQSKSMLHVLPGRYRMLSLPRHST